MRFKYRHKDVNQIAITVALLEDRMVGWILLQVARGLLVACHIMIHCTDEILLL
jgi:hypothetical protein